MLSLAAAALIAPYLVCQVAEAVGADWPAIHATLLAVMLGVIAWWLIEVGLVYVTALWETEHEQLARDRGLPRAVVYRSGRYTSTH
jgi:hypothetical protein